MILTELVGQITSLFFIFCVYLDVTLIKGLPTWWEASDGEAVWILPVSDLGLFHQVVQFFLSHVFHLLPVS